jgi:crotonobetainyl-CoA:carnitine CoA-transferase CaiB-like acyl-CoA transferase
MDYRRCPCKACACSTSRACSPARCAARCWPTFGAEVIKVEHPGRGDDTRDWGMRIGKTETTYYNSMNRNKRSITVDLQTPEA